MKRANGTVCRRCSFLRPLCTGHYFRRLWLSFSPRCRQTVDVDEEAVFASSTPSIPSGGLGSSHPMRSNRVRRERRQEQGRATTTVRGARPVDTSRRRFLPVDVSHLGHRQHRRRRHCCRRCCRRRHRHRRRHRCFRWQGESEGGTVCKIAAATTSLSTSRRPFLVDGCHGVPPPPARACAAQHAAVPADPSLPIFRSSHGWRRPGTAAVAGLRGRRAVGAPPG